MGIKMLVALVGCVVVVLVVVVALVGVMQGLLFVVHVKLLMLVMKRTMMGVSWKFGCFVVFEDLCEIRMRYWGFDVKVHKGSLIVNVDIVDVVVRAFGKFYDVRFLICWMELVDVYGGSDDALMVADNTLVFNCCLVIGMIDCWLNYFYGCAIDINMIENLYVKGTIVFLFVGVDYFDRIDVRLGMIVAGDVVMIVFAVEGFGWGGDYTSLKDY